MTERNVIFVRERWTDASHVLPQQSNLESTLKHSGFGVPYTICHDDPENAEGRIDGALMKMVKDIKPDMVLVAPVLMGYNNNIKMETLADLRSMGIKIVGHWGEGQSPDVVANADRYADVVDVNLFIDTRKQHERWSKFPQKTLGLYDPVNPDEYVPKAESLRDIGVSFIGTLLNRPERCSYIFTLLANGIPATKLGGNYEFVVSQDVLIEVLHRSRVGLNFSDAGPHFRAYKRRVAEVTMAGACLFDLANEETSNVLEPMKEYVPFIDTTDLLTKMSYYLTHDQERTAIAKRGQAKAIEKLDGRVFWKTLMARVGL